MRDELEFADKDDDTLIVEEAYGVDKYGYVSYLKTSAHGCWLNRADTLRLVGYLIDLLVADGD
jgi:hypothetical protein